MSDVAGEFEKGCLVVVLVSGDFERGEKLAHVSTWMALAKVQLTNVFSFCFI